MDENINPSPAKEVKSNNINTKIIWVGGLLLIILVATFFVYKWLFNKSGISPSTNNSQNIISNIDSHGTLEVFYYTVDDSSQQNAQYKIFKVSPNLEKADVNTHSFTIAGAGQYFSTITDSWKKNIILFITNSETQSVIYSLDVSSQNSQPQVLITIPLDSNKGEIVSDARFLDDGNSLTFITANDKNARAENSVLHIVSLQNQQNQESIPLSEVSPLYAGFGFLAATPDGKTIYLHETGGDAGAIWSQWYKVDRITKTVQKLEKLPPVAKGEGNPTISVFSPDRTKLAYIDFSAIVEQADLDFEDYNSGDYVGGPCLKGSNAIQKYEPDGGTIMIQDLRIGNTIEAFRNLSYSDNFCKNVARRIISLKWLDNSRLAFETIDGVYVLDINTKQKQTLFTFESTTSPGQQTRPSILSIQMPYIVFSDGSIVQTNTNKRLEFVAPEAQKGVFFISE